MSQGENPPRSPFPNTVHPPKCPSYNTGVSILYLPYIYLRNCPHAQIRFRLRFWWGALQRLSHPQKIRRANSTSLALGWLTRAHLQQCARTQVLTRAGYLSIALRARAIYRFSCLHHSPTRALANQNTACHLRQSGRLSDHHALAAKGEFYSHSRVVQLNTNASS